MDIKNPGVTDSLFLAKGLFMANPPVFKGNPDELWARVDRMKLRDSIKAVGMEVGLEELILYLEPYTHIECYAILQKDLMVALENYKNRYVDEQT